MLVHFSPPIGIQESDALILSPKCEWMKITVYLLFAVCFSGLLCRGDILYSL